MKAILINSTHPDVHIGTKVEIDELANDGLSIKVTAPFYQNNGTYKTETRTIWQPFSSFTSDTVRQFAALQRDIIENCEGAT